MLKHNNLENEVKSMAAAKGKTLGTLAEETGTSGSYVSRLIKKDPINPTFEALIEMLGYDIKIEYIPKS